MKVAGRVEEFIEYSKSHNLEETAKYFDINKPYARRLRKEWCGIVVPVQNKTGSISKKSFVAYKKNHSYADCAKHFDLSVATAFKLGKLFGLSTHYKKIDKSYTVNGHNIYEEFPEYCKEHTMTECAAYFGVSYSLIRWWCERYGVECKSKMRNLKQVARTLYILSNDKETLYFTNINDIATFIGLTYTRTNILINKEHKIHGYNVSKQKITSYRLQADKQKKQEIVYY